MTAPSTAPVAVVPAPAPTAAPLTIFMRCTENRVEDDYDGGIVLFQIIQGQNTDAIIDGRVVLSARHDEFMRAYPTTRDDKVARFFKVTLEEVPFADVPPDPSLPKAPSAFDLMAQARDAAAASGNTALAATLTSALATGVAAPSTPAAK